MRRREFMAGLGAAITGSIRTNAQQLPSVSLVGYLYAGPAEGFAFRQVAFRKGLAETDYFEGCNVAIETHWARSGVAVLVASGNAQAVLAAKAATTMIPIVFGLAADPVEIGLVSNLDHPGGNITGVTSGQNLSDCCETFFRGPIVLRCSSTRMTTLASSNR